MTSEIVTWPAPAVLWGLGGVFVVLLLASVLPLVLRGDGKAELREDLWRRTVSWWVMVVLVALPLFLGRGWVIGFWAFVSFLALKEFLSLIPTRRADRHVLFWAYLVIPFHYLWVYQYWYGLFIVFIPVWVFLALPLRMLFSGQTEGFLRAAGTLQWGLMATVFALSHLAYLFSLPGLETPAGPAGLLLFVLVVTQFNDVAQYGWGKALGGPKIVPKISPKKTWAGFLGGLATTMALSAFLAPLLTPFVGWEPWALGAVLALAGFAGDLVMSALKRDLGIKDTGATIPGHGGVLDRLDSLIFAAPVFFHLVFFFHHGARLVTGP